MNTIDHWIKFRGQQGGTIHDALREFADLPERDKDRFCGILSDNLRTLADPKMALEFMQIRFRARGLMSNLPRKVGVL